MKQHVPQKWWYYFAAVTPAVLLVNVLLCRKPILEDRVILAYKIGMPPVLGIVNGPGIILIDLIMAHAPRLLDYNPNMISFLWISGFISAVLWPVVLIGTHVALSSFAEMAGVRRRR